MALRGLMNLFCTIALLAIVNSTAVAIPIEVGAGENSAELYIEWDDGYVAEFIVGFEDVTVTGLGLFDIIEAETTLTTVREDFGWGVFIDGITFNGHSDIGFGGGEDWWHYWIKDAGQTEWTSPAFGVADRILYDGDSDGWIYGRAGTVPEPATLVLLGLGGLILRKRRE
ncbi:MAG: PEP-CTERM sorting domain-containing protein [Planctomycetota bacterium]|jgi:hypothetical protein